MRSSPPISVIIPTHNRSSFLQEALLSVRQQDLQPLETIVVDDGSTDDTALLCQNNFPQIHYLHQNRQGVSAARNRGLHHAKGDWIAFLDSDDLWLPDKLKNQWDYILTHPESRILQTEEIWIRRGLRVNARKKHQKQSGWIFDDTLPACEDYDLWLRAALRYPIMTLNKPLTIKRGGHADQLSSQHSLDSYRIQALLKILKDPLLTEPQRRCVIGDIKRRSAILIRGYQKRGRFKEAAHFTALTNTF